MNILFVSDFSLQQNSGGSQRSSSFLLEKGAALGHNIIEYNHDSSPTKLLYSYDLVISSNLEHIYSKQRHVFNYLINHVNHIRVERDSCLYLSANDRKELFTKAKKTFFLTDYHHESFVKDYGNYFHDVNIVYPFVDTDIFYEDDTVKDLDVIYCGFIHPLKGSGNLAKWALDNKDRKVHVFGWGDHSVFSGISNITFHGKAEYEDIPKIFRRSKYIYHSPIVNDPFCRMTAEASLCGCKFIGNSKKIGSIIEIQKNKIDNFKKTCQLAVDKFWNLI